MNDALLQYMNADDEPTATEAGNALAAALRRKQDLGTLGVLSGGRLAAPGQALLGSSNTDAQGLMHAQVARTARADRKSAAELAGLKDLRDYAFRQKEADENQVLRKESIAMQNNNADATRAIASATLGLARSNSEATQKNRSAQDLSDLRKEFNSLPDVKTFSDVDSAYQKVKSAAGNPSAAGDLSAIFAYMKMLDPGSSVREGEFANAQNAGGIDSKIAAAYNNVLNGQRLTEGQRADFIKQAAGLHAVHRAKYDTAAARYRELATHQNSAPDDVVPPPAAAAPAKKKFVIKDGKLVPAGG